MGRPYLGGSFNVWQNVTDGGEGVKKIEKSVDVVYGQPLNKTYFLKHHKKYLFSYILLAT